MKFLRFENQSAALSAFNPWIIEDQFPAYIGTVAVGEVGTVHKPTGETVSTPEGDVPVTAPIAGYWVYLSGRVPELQGFEVDEPEHVAWVFAGSAAATPEVARPKRKCTPAQGLVALFAVKGISDDDVRAAIEQITDPVQRYTARVAFERATEWEEDSPTMLLMQGMLELTTQDMHALFDYAETVRA